MFLKKIYVLYLYRFFKIQKTIYLFSFHQSNSPSSKLDLVKQYLFSLFSNSEQKSVLTRSSQLKQQIKKLKKINK